MGPDPVATWQDAAASLDWDDEVPVLQIPAAPPVRSAWPGWLPATAKAQIASLGVQTLYRHQQEAADAAWSGTDVALAAGTATGKSLAYLMPILAAIGDDEAMPATALYVAPTKALAHDQLRKLSTMHLPGLRAAAYDGDTPPEERRWVRRHGSVVVTNPDMLHAGILPNHTAWQSFIKRLHYIVVDEFHVYRGVFGAHLSAVLRRLLRVADHYGAAPSVIGTSATVAAPAQTLTALTGRPAVEVLGGSVARSPTSLVLVPPGDRGLVERAAALLADLVGRGVRTLAFVRSRRAAEVVSSLAQERLGADGRDALVASYRSGYLPEERRALERGLRDGDHLGIAATSALELGIDISGLDAVIVAGWPGTRAALMQRLGRAGRTGEPALAVFLADNNPLDAHLARNPEQILAQAERITIDADNPYVLGPHLCAAAAELPLVDDSTARFFGPAAAGLLPALRDRGLLRQRPSGWYWTRSDRPTDLADLRGGSADPVAVVEEGTGRLVGTVDRGSADGTVHEGAVYAHQGQDYLVLDLDQERGIATARRARLPYSTQPQSVRHTALRQVLRHVDWGPIGLHFGIVDVSTQVTGYLKRRIRTGEVVGGEPLGMPVRTLPTKAVWWTIPDDVLQRAGVPHSAVAGAAHAAEHAAIGMLPLFAQCDRWDIGGLSTPDHPDTGRCTIVVHDGLPGGAGFAERGFAVAQSWLRATARTIAACPCAEGCPSCVQSPKCGNGNEPLDKAGSLALLEAMLNGAGQAPSRPDPR